MNEIKKEEKIIMYDSPEAAIYKTDIEGWVSADGYYCGKGKQGEDSARYRGATHRKCETCDNVIKMRTYTKCESCRHKVNVENYQKMKFKEYDGSPVFDYYGDKYFFSEDDILEYLEENELESIDLVFCSENHWDKIEPDYWADIMPEDSEGDLPEKLAKALEAFNEVIDSLPVASYSPSDIRTTVTLKQLTK